jgi:hypothetical protein
MISIKITDIFKKEFKRLEKKSQTLTSSLLQLQKDLQKNPQMGVPLGNNFFKIRIKSDYSGKSGGYRVITYYQQEDIIILASLYQKSQQSSISQKELQKIIQDFFSG